MVPRLPPELIAQIQAQAGEDQPNFERQRLRAKFELVNREWYNLVNHFSHLIILRLSDIHTLGARRRGAPLSHLLGAKTKAISIEMHALNDQDGVEEVAGLLEMCSNVRSVRLSLGGRGLGLEGRAGAGPILINALASLENVRYFTSTAPSYTHPTTHFTSMHHIST